MDGHEAQDAVPFLEEMVEEHNLVAGDVVQIGEEWAIHGSIAVDGDVLMAVFERREDAMAALDELDRDCGHPG